MLVRAPILRSVEPTPELFEWVAHEGSGAWFGRVEVHDLDDDTVHLLLSHTLSASATPEGRQFPRAADQSRVGCTPYPAASGLVGKTGSPSM